MKTDQEIITEVFKIDKDFSFSPEKYIIHALSIQRKEILMMIEEKIQEIFKEELEAERKLGQYASAQKITDVTLRKFHEWLQKELKEQIED